MRCVFSPGGLSSNVRAEEGGQASFAIGHRRLSWLALQIETPLLPPSEPWIRICCGDCGGRSRGCSCRRSARRATAHSAVAAGRLSVRIFGANGVLAACTFVLNSVDTRRKLFKQGMISRFECCRQQVSFSPSCTKEWLQTLVHMTIPAHVM